MNEEFIKKIITLRGDQGKKWLESIPQIIKQYEQKWNIQSFSPFQLSYNYVAPAKTSSGQFAVLKISFPDNKEFISEIESLKFYNGEGAIRVLKEDRDNYTALLEKAEPGEPVKNVTPERKQITIISDLLKKLHKPIPTENNIFPTISNWAKSFDIYLEKFSIKNGPVPQRIFEKAKEIFIEYPKDKKEQVLLHGDLHTDNILSSQRGWLVIDPKGVIGEREFELGACLRNPYYDYPKGSDYKKLETEKILQFSEELGFDKVRIRNWAFACAVISLLWFLEDENKLNEIYIQNAELLNEVIV